MRRFLFGLVVVATVGLAPAGCGSLESLDYAACSRGDECAYPYVCCTAPGLPDGEHQPPYCAELQYCEAFLPPLVQGNPCNRRPTEGSVAMTTLQSCISPLVCCAKTLTCSSAEGCDQAAPPPVEPDSGATCAADPECPAGEVCCNIDIVRRDGRCRSVDGCAQFVQSGS